MKKLMLLLGMILLTTVCFSQVPKLNIGYINMPDTATQKINWLTNQHAYTYMTGTKLSPSWLLDLRDSGFSVTNGIYLRILNFSGLKSLVQFGIDGTGTFSIGGRPSGDTTTAFTRMFRVDYDSTVVHNFLKLGLTTNDPTVGGMLYRTGAGDTLNYSYGSTPSIARVFWGTPSLKQVLAFDGRYWLPQTVTSLFSGFKYRVAGGSYYTDSVTVNGTGTVTVSRSNDTLSIAGRDSVAKANTANFTTDPYQHTYVFPWAMTTADSERVAIWQAPGNQNFTVDSMYVEGSGTFTGVTFNAKKLHSGSFSDMLSSNYTVTTSAAKPSGIQNNTFVGTDCIYVTIRGLSTGQLNGCRVTFFIRRTS